VHISCLPLPHANSPSVSFLMSTADVSVSAAPAGPSGAPNKAPADPAATTKRLQSELMALMVREIEKQSGGREQR